MKRFFKYLRTRPLAMISFIIIIIFYLFMIFAEFIAPYSPTRIFEEDTFHPANLELSTKGIVAREYRVLTPITWRYAKVKGLTHKVSFFVKGEPYKLMGLIPCSRHLFGIKADVATGETYPVFLCGADNLGRDLFSRMVYGSRISLTIGFVTSAFSLILAILLGGIAGYYGGAADWTVMRLSEFFMLIPGLYLILFLRSLLNTKMDSGTSYMIITIILSLVGWPGSARTLRGMIHAIKREDFIQNAQLEGVPSVTIIFSQIIPQISSLLIVSTTLAVPGFIMSETTLSYLGLGIADPSVSWGSLINRDISTLSNLRHFPWLLTPVWALLAVTLAFNFLGDAMRDYFDPYHTIFPTWKRRKIEKLIDGSSTASDGTDFGAVGSVSRGVSAEGTESASGGNFSEDAGISADTPIAAPAAIATITPSASPTDGAQPAPFLQVKDLQVFFAMQRGKESVNIQSVRGVSFAMERGEILGIVGESGSGKTVTTTAIPALLPPNAFVRGKVIFEGTELSVLSQKEMREWRGKKIGLILQEPGRSFDPLQNIGKVFLETFRNSEPEITKEEAQKRAIKLLTETGLPDPQKRLKSFPHQFSGGQLQRISIALALAQGCDLLIADEPTTALDVTIQAQIVSLLAELRRTRGLSIIFISHNIDLVAELCDNIIVMHNGVIVERGTSEQIMHDAKDEYTKALLAARPRFGTHYSDKKTTQAHGGKND